jgi:hypothetical protein
MAFPCEVALIDVFERRRILAPNQPGLTQTAFNAMLGRLGMKVRDQEVQKLWVENCRELFEVDESAADALVLDADDAYRLIRHASFCAKHLREGREDPETR